MAALLEGEASGYDLAKVFDASVANFWPATPQQLYRELVTAVRVAARGEAMLSPKITKRVLTDFASGGGSSRARARLADLTPREHDVAVHIGRGLSNAEIARALVVSESTVKVHIGHIMAKLEAANRTQVALVVHDAGLS